MKNYRALISIPVEAASDDAALAAVHEQAASVVHPDGAVAGHVEILGEVDDAMEIIRVVHADAMFVRQLPPDWKA